MGRLRAVLWDVDGTLAESERDGHRVAFNMAFEACGIAWRWDESHYGDLLHVTGGRERLLFDMQTRSDAPAAPEREALARTLHAKKNAFYAALVEAGAVPLREGVMALMQECRERRVRMGITTTTSRANLEALMAVHLGGRWAEGFAVTVCGEDVQRKKPDPQVYLKALRELDVECGEAVAIEDAPGGVAAARAAGVAVLVTRSAYFAKAPIAGAVAVGPGLHDRRGWRPRPLADPDSARRVCLDDIEAWCAQAHAV